MTSVEGSHLDELIGLLACPLCRGRVESGGTKLSCVVCGEPYRIIDGVAVMLPGAPEVDRVPASHESFQLPDDLLEEMRALPGRWLHIGGGASQRREQGCVELELSIFTHTDVIGDVARLPFADREFEAVVAFNVFEHLPAPVSAAAEIRRVLVPGGRLYIQSAFLQPLHADPSHYYNASEAGMRRWFESFDVEDVSVSPNFNPAFALSWFASDLLFGAAALDDDTVGVLAATTLAEWAQFWRDPDQRGVLWDVMVRLPDDVQRRLAAGFEVRARRPLDS